MKIKKPLIYLAITSFLTLAPMTICAQNTTYSDEYLKEKIDLANYAVKLATDIDDDGKPDKEGYKTLLMKFDLKYNEDQSLEEFQKIIYNYIENLKTKNQFSNLNKKAYSMFTGKDYEMFMERLDELTDKYSKEIEEKLEELEEYIL